MIVSGYSIDLYCDGPLCERPWDCSKETFAGESYASCARQAVKRGWRLKKDRSKAICPRCQKPKPAHTCKPAKEAKP